MALSRSPQPVRSLDATELNYDLNYNMFLLKSSLHNLKTVQDKQSVNRWMHKLLGSNRSLTEMKIRNDFLYHLVSSVQDGELKPPFAWYPPGTELVNLTYLLTGKDDKGKASEAVECEGVAAGEEAIVSELYNPSPDPKDFLIGHPVAKCGAYCYLSMITKIPPKPEKKLLSQL